MQRRAIGMYLGRTNLFPVESSLHFIAPPLQPLGERLDIDSEQPARNFPVQATARSGVVPDRALGQLILPPSILCDLEMHLE
jgi:hypothetical protein